MNALARLLGDRIAATGPISVADYMAECLLHPTLGYYSTRDPFGAGGDFTTAPEISQMFGELLGLWLAQCWIDQGRPSPFLLAEVGPGRGTLMADMLRAMAKVPGLLAAAQVHLIEASATLRDLQAKTLHPHKITWRAQVADLPEGPLFLVANEFFDALPIRQFQRDGTGWRERQVGLAAGQLAIGLAPACAIPALDARLPDTKSGDIVEICPALPAIATELARRVCTHGGVALFVDYGGWRSLGDTFQALKDHRPADPLANPGQTDLTAHVDFEALSTACRAAGAQVSGMTPQGAFLERLGIAARTRTLAQNLTGTALESHLAAYRRLTDPSEMGQLFKVLACRKPGTPPPPALDHP